MDARQVEERQRERLSVTSPKILVLRFSAIGDCVMTAWAVTALRHHYPKSEIVWGVERRCQAAVDPYELVSQRLQIPRDVWKKRRWSPETWRQQLAYYSSLRHRRFDYGMDFQGHSKTAIALRIAAPKKRMMARATDSLAAKMNPLLPGDPSNKHVVDWNHDLLQEFDKIPFVDVPMMPMREETQPGLVTISVGAGSDKKKWPRDNWLAVAASLAGAGARVVFLGGPEEPPANVPGCEDLIGKTSLERTVALVGESVLHLSADTGTGHMAAAYRIPAISIFGPTPPEVYRPYSDTSLVLRHGTETANVTVTEVTEAALQKLAVVMS